MFSIIEKFSKLLFFEVKVDIRRICDRVGFFKVMEMVGFLNNRD